MAKQKNDSNLYDSLDLFSMADAHPEYFGGNLNSIIEKTIDIDAQINEIENSLFETINTTDVTPNEETIINPIKKFNNTFEDLKLSDALELGGEKDRFRKNIAAIKTTNEIYPKLDLAKKGEIELNITRENSYQGGFVVYGTTALLEVGENTVINTPATNDRSEERNYLIDNIASVEADPTSYVVTGGSFLVKYHKDTTAELSTTPINGAANGNEKLTYFQLADPSVTSLSPLNSNGQRYTYGVANPSSDGNKYVWVPSEKVTFSLGDNPSATFADGTNANKETVAMRGHTIGMAVRANDEEIPSFNTTPISNDTTKQFKGWFYRDATGNVLPFDPNTTEVLKTMNVFAMWEEVPQVVPTPTQPSQPTTSVTPKTSDNTNIGYQIGVLLVSLSAVVILLKARNLVTK